MQYAVSKESLLPVTSCPRISHGQVTEKEHK